MTELISCIISIFLHNLCLPCQWQSPRGHRRSHIRRGKDHLMASHHTSCAARCVWRFGTAKVTSSVYPANQLQPIQINQTNKKHFNCPGHSAQVQTLTAIVSSLATTSPCTRTRALVEATFTSVIFVMRTWQRSYRLRLGETYVTTVYSRSLKCLNSVPVTFWQMNETRKNGGMPTEEPAARCGRNVRTKQIPDRPPLSLRLQMAA